MENKNSENKPEASGQDLASQGEALRASNEELPATDPSKGGQAEQAKRKLPIPKILVAGIVILITLLAFGLIAYLMMSQNKTQLVNDNSSIVNEAPTPTPDPTAGWRTYEGDRFSIKYPPYLKFQDLVNHEDGWTLTLNDKEENDVMGNTINNSLIISYDQYPTQVYSNSPITDINQVWEGDDEKEFYQIQGHDAVKIMPKSVALDNGTKISSIYLYVLKDGSLWSINIDGKEELDQILSTFKFSDASDTGSVDTSSWKTYTSLDGSFKMKYPNNYIQFSAQAYKGGYEEINLAYSPENKINKNNQNPSQNEILILPRQYVVPFDISGHTNDEIIQKLANQEGASKYVSGGTVVPWINGGGKTYDGKQIYMSADFEQTTINSNKAAKLFKSNDSLCYLILKNKKSYLEICALPANSKYIPEFEKIISTFEFIE